MSNDTIIVKTGDNLQNIAIGKNVTQIISSTEVGSKISDEIRHFDQYIEDKANEFIGRDFVFEAINQFIKEKEHGYFFVRGDPGIGKTALSSHLVKTKQIYLHHFNIRAQGIKRTSVFLRNICSRLIAKYDLGYSILPSKVDKDGGFLSELLEKVSGQQPGEKIIIVVDALDEVDESGEPCNNILCLPPNLPKSVYIVATIRRDAMVPLHVECEQVTLLIKHDSILNDRDIRSYLNQKVKREGIHKYVLARYSSEEGIGTSDEQFVNELAQKSEGNFMYLRYVLPEIERGVYDKDVIPVGLRGYYDVHWERMGMMAKPLPHVKIKIIYILSEIREPASRYLIARYARENELSVQEVIDEWGQFLHQQHNEEIRYSIYHSSFRDFLHDKEIVKVAGVTIENINAQMASVGLENLYGKEWRSRLLK